jgi:DNA repair exonuclease SbcCD ATPase subunit
MAEQIQQLRNRLEQQKGQQQQLQKTVETLEIELKEKTRSLRQHEQAREVIKEVGLKTQQELEFHISDITSLALESVFSNPYQLKIEFVQRRNKTECDLFFERDGNRFDPIDSSGVGTIDVAAFALRIASWSMQNPHSRNTIIMDEPFRFLSANYQEQASQMIKEISKRLGIQFIVVTHEPVLASYADKTFEVSIKNGISKII